MNTSTWTLKALAVVLTAAFAGTAQAAGPTLTMPSLGSSARPAPAAPSLGVNTTFRPAPNLAPVSAPRMPAAPAPAPATSLSVGVPYTGGYVRAGAQPPANNPGTAITVTPKMIDIPVGNNQAPQSAYGATVTVPLGTIRPQR
ncbi:MAG: hypothetical protein WCE79_01275 [Xanthobacteraceae bacterium]